MQMQELDRALNLDVKPSSSRAPESSNGTRENLTRSISEDVSSEGEKERALAKAALSVSELGKVATNNSEYLTDVVQSLFWTDRAMPTARSKRTRVL